MSEKMARALRKEIKQRFDADLDALMEAITELPFMRRVGFALKILLGHPGRAKSDKRAAL